MDCGDQEVGVSGYESRQGGCGGKGPGPSFYHQHVTSIGLGQDPDWNDQNNVIPHY